MKIEQNVDLQRLHTFGLKSKADSFIRVRSEKELKKSLALPTKKKLVIGGGSNIVFVKNYNGLLIKNEIWGKCISREFKNYSYVSAKSGENWHELVQWCIDKNLGGIENLSLIPGSVGAAPIQNIGAYGVELKDVLVKLNAVEISTGKSKVFWNKECKLAYRESIFKKKLKGKYIITEITLKLKKAPHNFKLDYGAINEKLEGNKSSELNIASISKAIIAIRESKLPDPEKIGNCGSFFKNPIVDKKRLQRLLLRYPDMPNYLTANKRYKLAAGWLIEKTGWKGKSLGRIGCYKKQALVLINLGGANGEELLNMVTEIKKTVYDKFEIELAEEVNLV